MALASFRGLVDWCACSGASRRRHVAAALVYLYDGPHTPVRGAWRGTLTCSGGTEPRFAGVLRTIDGELDRPGALDLSIRVTEDGAWAEVRGAGMDEAWAHGLRLVDIAASGSVVEARFDTGRTGQRLSCFASAGYA